MNKPKMLIEVAMPVKEISAESIRDKSIRHGHISTLHLWWARRPLPVCRAVVFASLVPDPLDENCPEDFKEAVKELLGPNAAARNLLETLSRNKDKIISFDPYKPYDDIPFTTAIDKMEDNLRNRLLMFIGKFSDLFIHNEKKGKKTAARNQLSGFSLIKWDNKNNEEILTIARKLMWVAHDPDKNTLNNFEKYYSKIKQAEKALYKTSDRHIPCDEVKQKEKALQTAIDNFLDRMPKVFDPFAGGGAIPLEASRLGCRTYANDLNPVAHIIEKASLEFPQKYGKPNHYSRDEFIRIYGEEEYNRQKTSGMLSGDDIHIPNRLSFDVEYFAKKLLALAEEEIGRFYPEDENGNKPIAYYWARVATCSNPSCKAEVPLLKQFYLVNKKDKKVHLKPIIKGNKIDFEIKYGELEADGWNNRGNMICPCCGNTTDVKTVKKQFIEGMTKEKMLAVICEGKNGKEYRKPNKKEVEILNDLSDLEQYRPKEKMPVEYTQALPSCTWGLETWGQMFSNRQLLVMQTLVEKLHVIKPEVLPLGDKYGKAVVMYLGIWFNKYADYITKFCTWMSTGEKIAHVYAKQAISMVFDYPESYPFSKSTGSLQNMLGWIIRYIESESNYLFSSICNHAASGDKFQFNTKKITTTITDPPYYDAIAYADLSDFFYVWLKRSISDLYPPTFAYPQTPKSEECTALKHHYGGKYEKAKEHFETKLNNIFSIIERQTDKIISIMFAHQSTEAWTTLCNSILNANMNIHSSWALDSERLLGIKEGKAFLSSSITVTCRPSHKSGFGEYKEIKQAILSRIKQEVQLLYRLGFRGADLLTACFGQAVSVFGQYEKVEKADGKEVTVAELLEMAREAAFNAIVSDIDTDDVTRFYIGWLNLFGFTQADHDNVRRITQIGLNIDINILFQNHLLLRNGNKESLASLEERVKLDKKFGIKKNSFMIDQVHYAMFLFGGTSFGPGFGSGFDSIHAKKRPRILLLEYISKTAPSLENPFWRILNSLSEILPAGTVDRKTALGLLANKENLVREAHEYKETKQDQGELDF